MAIWRTNIHKSITIIIVWIFLQLTNFKVRPVVLTQIDKPLCKCNSPQDSSHLIKQKPFSVVWNSPTGGCQKNFSIPIELTKYDIKENENQEWNGKAITVFYGAQLGLYPYYTEDGRYAYNNGLPQLVDLAHHLRKSEADIKAKIPDPNYTGLAVIDWEPWRPLWERNWNKKRMYQTRSIDLLRSQHPDWPLNKLEAEAKGAFERSGRALFEETIKTGRRLRPNALWGFYGFPDCFGHGNHRFQCNDEVKLQNNRLSWLFDASSAVFPSMYLLDQHTNNRDYVTGRLREAFRMAEQTHDRQSRTVPVYPYFRSIYMTNPAQYKFLDEPDLRNTIGVAADLGASGIVAWGNRNDENTSPEVCRRINAYVSSTLGPFIQDTARKVERCNIIHCHNKGRCINKEILSRELKLRYEKPHPFPYCGYTAASPTRILTRHPTEKQTLLGKPLQTTQKVKPSSKLANVKNGTYSQSGTSINKVTNSNTLKLNEKYLDTFQDNFTLANEKMKHNQSKVNHGGETGIRAMKKQTKQDVLENRKSDVPALGVHLRDHIPSKHRFRARSIFPHMYVLLIALSIGGVLVFSLIFLTIYYVQRLRKDVVVVPQAKQQEAKKSPDVPRKRSQSKQDKDLWKPSEDEESEVEVDLDSFTPVQ